MAFLLLFFFLLMLLCPQLTFLGAKTGLTLWFQNVLPSLLPFFIFTNLLLETDSVSYITLFLHPLFHWIFKTSPYGSYTAVTGLLCGFPMGSKSVAELVKREKLSPKEALYLTSFCNNASPAFIVSFVCHCIFYADRSCHLPIILAFLASPVLTGILFRFLLHPDTTVTSPLSTPALKQSFTFSMLDQAMMNGFETALRLGGYLITFSILSAFIQAAVFLPTELRLFLTALTEMTTGASLLGKMEAPLLFRVLAVCACISFSGLSGLAQSLSFLKEAAIPGRYYLAGRLVNTLLCLLLIFLFYYGAT